MNKIEQLQGYLVITVKKANLTHDTELMGKMDPYVIMKIGKVEQRTTVQLKAGKIPEWNETFEFLAKDGDLLEIGVWDKEDLISDDFVGDTRVTINKETLKIMQSQWLPVFFGSKKEKGGEILIELTYVERIKDTRDYAKELEDKEKELAELRNHKGNLSESLEHGQKEKNSLILTLEHNNTEMIRLQCSEKTLQTEVNGYKDQIKQLNSEKDQIIQMNEKCAVENKSKEDSLNGKIDALNQQVKSLESELTQKAQVKNSDEELKKALETWTAEKQELISLNNTQSGEIKDLKQKIKNLEADLAKKSKSSRNSLTIFLMIIIFILTGLLVRS